MSIEETLARIATALEAIADHLAGHGVDVIDVASPVIDVEHGAHEWVEASKTFEPVVRRSRAKPTATGRPDRRGQPLKCGRCRREGRSRMNHSNRCVECQHEEWWDE